MAGINSDHTEAATITPEAKPRSDFCTRGDISSFMKNTKAEPSIVPNNGISSPKTIFVIAMQRYVEFSEYNPFSSLINDYLHPASNNK